MWLTVPGHGKAPGDQAKKALAEAESKPRAAEDFMVAHPASGLPVTFSDVSPRPVAKALSAPEVLTARAVEATFTVPLKE